MKNSYYAIIPANVRYDKSLTPNAKLVYGEITALCNEKGYCWASNEYFANLYEVSKVSISKWINQLVEKGYINSVLKYKEGTKEVECRYLTILVDNTPHQDIFNTPHQGNLTTPPRKLDHPHQGKLKVNTTINNTTNNTQNIGGKNTSTGTAKKKSSKLISVEKDYSKKNLNWINKKLTILDEFDFTDEVKDAFYEYLDSLSEMGSYLSDVSVRAQLTKLASQVESPERQINVITSTVIRGWKSIDYMINEENKAKTGNFDTAKNSTGQEYTEQEKKQMRDEYKKAIEDGDDDIF